MSTLQIAAVAMVAVVAHYVYLCYRRDAEEGPPADVIRGQAPVLGLGELFTEQPETDEGGSGDDGGGEGQKTCTYTNEAGRACRTEFTGARVHCKRHACGMRTCKEAKSSKAQFCPAHAANVASAPRGRRGRAGVGTIQRAIAQLPAAHADVAETNMDTPATLRPASVWIDTDVADTAVRNAVGDSLSPLQTEGSNDLNYETGMWTSMYEAGHGPGQLSAHPDRPAHDGARARRQIEDACIDFDVAGAADAEAQCDEVAEDLAPRPRVETTTESQYSNDRSPGSLHDRMQAGGGEATRPHVVLSQDAQERYGTNTGAYDLVESGTDLSGFAEPAEITARGIDVDGAIADGGETRRTVDSTTASEAQGDGRSGGEAGYDSVPLQSPPVVDRRTQPNALEAGYGGANLVTRGLANTSDADPPPQCVQIPAQALGPQWI